MILIRIVELHGKWKMASIKCNDLTIKPYTVLHIWVEFAPKWIHFNEYFTSKANDFRWKFMWQRRHSTLSTLQSANANYYLFIFIRSLSRCDILRIVFFLFLLHTVEGSIHNRKHNLCIFTYATHSNAFSTCVRHIVDAVSASGWMQFKSQSARSGDTFYHFRLNRQHSLISFFLFSPNKKLAEAVNEWDALKSISFTIWCWPLIKSFRDKRILPSGKKINSKSTY